VFKKILVATDSLDVCNPPAALAVDLAKQEKARIYLMHVLESSYTLYRDLVKDFRTGEEINATAEYIQAVKKTMEENCAGALSGCKDYVLEAKAGFAWMEILKMARTADIDLIVVGPHRGRAEEKGVVRTRERLGSTVEAIIMRARCPVMIVRRVVAKGRLAFKRILLCTDFSDTCQYALEFSLKVAQKYASRLYIFHVLTIPVGEQVSYLHEQIEREIPKAKERMQMKYAKQIKRVDHSFDVWEGVPPIEIPKYARVRGIDLIIMGSHVREQKKRWYLGSVVDGVSLGSYCPVITVTRPKSLLKFQG